MIVGILHSGSGLGNQLHRYVAARVLALDKGYDFTMAGVNNFKGSSFMNLDMGVHKALEYHVETPAGKLVVDTDLPLWEEKTNYYNPEFNFVEDNTIIDGEFQDERYFGHRLKEIDSWLKVEPLELDNNLCVIGFRGGEFTIFPELFLPKQYWLDAIAMMQTINPKMKYEIHTDDPETAEFFFGQGFKIIHDIEINWRSVRYAKYAIIANSSFYILPRLLRHHEDRVKYAAGGAPDIRPLFATTIAPRYWARHNIKEWSMPQNYYKSFKYV